MGDLLNDILRAADKHPNSRVSKLIRTVEEEPSQKNIVLLLIELSEHAEYATDFNISLRYYLDLFERLGIDRDLILNEAGLLLVNSSKIYSKRVDYVQSLVERQILTLSNADHEIQQQKEQNDKEAETESATPAAEKPKRGRKRPIDAPTDPYEVQLEPKKFKKMTQEKRFAQPKTPTKAKSLLRNIEVEQQIHPSGWLHATIYDLENDEDVDTKRNYKLFTYHIEHRYNTLVPDINFRLHFKVKDYMDAQEEEMDGTDEATNYSNQVWPPLSEAYVQKYIHLENHILQQEIDPTKRWNSPQRLKNVSPTNAVTDKVNETLNNMGDTTGQRMNTTLDDDNSIVNDSGMGTSVLESSIDTSRMDTTLNNETHADADKSLNASRSEENDSALGTSILSSSINSSQLDTTTTSDADKTMNSTHTLENDSALGESILDETNNLNEPNKELNSSNITNCGGTGVQTTNTESLEDFNKSQNENVDATSNSKENGSSSESKGPEVSSSELKEGGDKNAIISGSSDNEKEISTPEDKDVGERSTTATTERSEIGKEASTLAEKDNNNAPADHCESSNATKEISSNVDGPTKESESTNSIPENSENAEVAKEKETKAENNSTLKENPVNSTDDINNPDGVQQPLSKESSKESETISNADPSATAVENTKEKDDFIQVEIHVLEDNENVPSERLQLRIPNTDDEGVHLSDVYENDLRLLSPTIKLSNIMPGVTNKDVTIHLDQELRDALELRDGMIEHFSQETYKVPVVEEPTQQPLLFNILRLPSKLVRRKVLFKLGPDMDLFLKARSLKIARPVPPPREYRRQLQFFPLNNTDMSGIIDTPPNSPGHASDFCGFTDDEFMNDDEDTCTTEFCGFTEDEQNILKVSVHRLSRDSGVGADVTTLTPEKEPLNIIFEETSADMQNCKMDLSKQFANEENMAVTKETTEELLNDLSASVRAALEAEIAEKTTVDGVELTKETRSEVETTGDTATNESGKNGDGEVSNEKLNGPTDGTVCNETKENNSAETTIVVEATPDTGTGVEKCTSDSDGKENECQLITEAIENGNSNKDVTQEQDATSSPVANIKESVDVTSKSDESCVTNQDTSPENQNSSEALNTNSSAPIEQIVDEQTNKAVESELKSSEKENNNQESSRSQQDVITIADQSSKPNTITQECDNDSDNSQDNAFFDLELQGAKTKIQQWHEHLRPILAKSRERHHFDVFQLGTEIIDTIQTANEEEQNIQPETTFHNVMDCKDRSYVSRYFLSTLLLANQSNVNIFVENKSSENPSAWSDIKLKLLSTKRHTVAIEDNIGMISSKKRKPTSPNEDKATIKKKSKFTNVRLDSDDDVDSLEDSEPLVKLQTSKKKLKEAPNKRSWNCNESEVSPKKSRDMANSAVCAPNTKELLVLSQQHLPPTNLFMDMACTSSQATRPVANCEVNLNNIRLLQPIEKIPRQGDDYDSGIFSIGEMSSS